MRKHGTTSAGTQRWRCVLCVETGTRKRRDQQARSWHQRFVDWLTSSTSLGTIARRFHCAVSTVTRHFAHEWKKEPAPPRWTAPSSIVVLDGTSLVAREEVVLIARGIRGDTQRSWVFVPRETTAAWSMLLARIPPPQFVVCDGQKGLLKALRTH